ncbi:MAG: CDGSH iron-sulfur domain-containing protein [Flavobacteriaceae bacterium]|jgi:CDGSH iron-sulfur domain-containing protein 3|nr:CDGSH iron-sulfur domain-containing protein [Flavobacteriaceae bacterium]
MSSKKVIIFRKSKGQIVVQGDVKLTNEEGEEIEHSDRFTLCGCSKSKKLPFCDGSHKKEI